MTYRLVCTDDTVRVRWAAKLWLRANPALAIARRSEALDPALIHLDGLSVYGLDESGLVRVHRLENFEITSDRQQQRLASDPAERLRVALTNGWPLGAPEPALPLGMQPLMTSTCRSPLLQSPRW